jgi:2-polyprenyl-3-methyl-5-hydroxy-6-metoxy-1,4-benzoquinol methylase
MKMRRIYQEITERMMENFEDFRGNHRENDGKFRGNHTLVIPRKSHTRNSAEK